MKNNILKRHPLNGTFELTARCNLSCKMCLIRIDNNRMAELGGRERTADEWIHMAKEVCESGTISLLLTGGEPMLRPDFIKIYSEISKMGFILTLYTNATLVTNEVMDLLRKYPPHEIGITVYGASQSTYEKVTGNGKAYKMMLEGVDQLKKLPSKLTIRTTLINDNLQDLDEMTEWAKNIRPDVEFTVSRIVTKPVRGGVADVESCRLTPEQNAAMLEKRNKEIFITPLKEFLKENKEHYGMISSIENELNQQEKPWDKAIEDNGELNLYGCNAGINSYTISWDGKLIGCQLLGDAWTYPFKEGFQNAWDEYPNCVNIPPIPEKCVNCEINCCACPATRLAETGSLNSIPDYICKESHLVSMMCRDLINDIKNAI